MNFNRGLMAGIWPVRDSLEAEFIGAAEKVKHEAETLPHAEAKKLLGDFTCRMCAKRMKRIVNCAMHSRLMPLMLCSQTLKP